MSNATVKKERGCALVWSTRKGSGWITVRLTTPLRSRAFFAPCISRTAGKAAIMASPRTEVETSLHRLANHIECQLADIFQQLMAESRVADVSSIAWHGNEIINTLRDVRDGKEGGR